MRMLDNSAIGPPAGGTVAAAIDATIIIAEVIVPAKLRLSETARDMTIGKTPPISIPATMIPISAVTAVADIDMAKQANPPPHIHNESK